MLISHGGNGSSDTMVENKLVDPEEFKKKLMAALGIKANDKEKEEQK